MDGKDLYTQEAVEEEVNENFKDNSNFLITAKKLRDTIKDIVATLWRKNYTAKEEDINSTIYGITQTNYKYTIANFQMSGNDGSMNCYQVNIPKCDTLVIPVDIIGNNAYLYRINMRNVENGQILNLLCHCRLLGNNNYTTNPMGDQDFVIDTRDADELDEWFTDSEYKNKMENVSNIAFPFSYGGFNSRENNITKRRYGKFFLQFIYWEGYWYPVNIY